MGDNNAGTRKTLAAMLDKLTPKEIDSYIETLEIALPKVLPSDVTRLQTLRERLDAAKHVRRQKNITVRRKRNRKQSIPTRREKIVRLSPEDKYDSHGRAPTVYEPRDPSPGTIKVAPRRQDRKRRS
jgi:hypothetical protein